MILVATMVYGRWRVFDIWARNMQRLGLQVLAVGSEGEISRRQVERYGFTYREHPNEPLGAKAQSRLEHAREMEWTHLLCLGSDDVISPDHLDYLRKKAEKHDLIASYDLNIWYSHPQFMGLWYSPGYQNYRKGEPVAPGRLISRELLDRIGWELWPPVERGLDKPAWNRLKDAARSPHYFRGSGVIDIKTNENISRNLPERHHVRLENDRILEMGFAPELLDSLSRLSHSPLR